MKRIRSERGCHVVWTFPSKEFVAVLPTRDTQADRTTRVAMVNGPSWVLAVIEGSMSALAKLRPEPSGEACPFCRRERHCMTGRFAPEAAARSSQNNAKSCSQWRKTRNLVG